MTTVQGESDWFQSLMVSHRVSKSAASIWQSILSLRNLEDNLRIYSIQLQLKYESSGLMNNSVKLHLSCFLDTFCKMLVNPSLISSQIGYRDSSVPPSRNAVVMDVVYAYQYADWYNKHIRGWRETNLNFSWTSSPSILVQQRINSIFPLVHSKYE